MALFTVTVVGTSNLKYDDSDYAVSDTAIWTKLN
jgi:hypothetical protein